MKINIKLFLFNILIYFFSKIIRKDFLNKIVDNTDFNKEIINILFKKFKKIDKKIKSAHNTQELYIMILLILTLKNKGNILEFGSYKGNSTAKLSLLCKLTNRKLYVFDSFNGLPFPSDKDKKHKYMSYIYHKKYVEYQKNDYSGSLKEVKKNIKKYGNIEVCNFIKGYYNKSLMNFNEKIDIVFIDVDLIDSAKPIIKYIWNKINKKGYLFSHEGLVIDYIKELNDSFFWNYSVKAVKPLFYGLGYGISYRFKSLSIPSNIFYAIKN